MTALRDLFRSIRPAFSTLSKLSTLQWTLGVSLLLHAAVLTVRFIDPEGFHRVFQHQALEVVLVNAQSADKPSKALTIAQTNLSGGGTDSAGRAASPLPYSDQTRAGNDLEEAQRQLDALQEQQTQMLTQLRNELAALPTAKPGQPGQQAHKAAEEEKRRQLLKLLAEIEKRIEAENDRPTRRYIGPTTREEVFARYYDALRRKVEDKGTANFPEQAGQKIYGDLTMVLNVNHDGQVLSTQVVQSSGNPLLDRRAEAIARSAGPFGRFSPEMRLKADQLAVVSRFRFTRDQTLEATVKNDPSRD